MGKGQGRTARGRERRGGSKATHSIKPTQFQTTKFIVFSALSLG